MSGVSKRVSDEERILMKLERDGILSLEAPEGPRRTTRRWQIAMARAAHELVPVVGEDPNDLRVPIALALLDFYGEDIHDDLLACLVEVVLAIEAAELAVPRKHLADRMA